jgi:hypothetical protein
LLKSRVIAKQNVTLGNDDGVEAIGDFEDFKILRSSSSRLLLILTICLAFRDVIPVFQSNNATVMFKQSRTSLGMQLWMGKANKP